MKKQLVIIGAGGHGKVVADIARQNGYDEISFLDDNTEIKVCGGYKVIGVLKDAITFENSDFIVGVGESHIRQKIQKKLVDDGLRIVSLIHPKAVIADDVAIGTGTVIMAGAIVNPATQIGDGCIINTGATVDHDNTIHNFAHVSVGSHLAGTVKVGECTLIGAGAVVSNNVVICGDCVIGAGAVVVKDIDKSGTYVGVPVRKI